MVGFGSVGVYDQWVTPTISGLRPKARYEHGAAVIDDKMYIYGGNHNGRYLNDLQVLDLRNWTWSRVEAKVPPVALEPSPIIASPCAGHSLIPWGKDKLLSIAGHTKDPFEFIQDYPKLEAETKLMADELGSDHHWSNITFRTATEEVEERIKSALNSEGENYGCEVVCFTADVGQGTTQWSKCNSDHYELGRNDTDTYKYDISSSVVYHRNLTKKNCRALIYSGDHDMIFLYIGTRRWIHTLGLGVDRTWKPWFVKSHVARCPKNAWLWWKGGLLMLSYDSVS